MASPAAPEGAAPLVGAPQPKTTVLPAAGVAVAAPLSERPAPASGEVRPRPYDGAGAGDTQGTAASHWSGGAGPGRRHVESSPQGRYLRFDEKLGSGQYKDVYRAYDTSEGIEVAWNTVNITPLPREEKKRIMNEVRLLQNLEHRNLVQFHGSWVNREKEQVIFVTEIVVNGSLKDFINKVEVIRWKVIKRWARQILRGLEYLHTHETPIIHRDLKCDNIFINGHTGDIRIGDLGLSTSAARTNRNMSVLGTPEFMAPELYDESYNEKVDIYAFGMCMLEMITKERPYSECANAAQIYKRVTAGVLPAGLHRVTLRTAADFIRLCLDFDPDQRPSASELLTHPFLGERADEEDNMEATLGPPLPEGEALVAGSGPAAARQLRSAAAAELNIADASHPAQRGAPTLMTIEEALPTETRSRFGSTTSGPEGHDSASAGTPTNSTGTGPTRTSDESAGGDSSGPSSPTDASTAPTDGRPRRAPGMSRQRSFSFSGAPEPGAAAGAAGGGAAAFRPQFQRVTRSHSLRGLGVDAAGAPRGAAPVSGGGYMSDESDHDALLAAMPDSEANMRSLVLPEGRADRDADDSIALPRPQPRPQPAAAAEAQAPAQQQKAPPPAPATAAAVFQPEGAAAAVAGGGGSMGGARAAAAAAARKAQQQLTTFRSSPGALSTELQEQAPLAPTGSAARGASGGGGGGVLASAAAAPLASLNVGVGVGEEVVLVEGGGEDDDGSQATQIKYALSQGTERDVMRLVMHTHVEGRLQEVEFDFNLERDSAAEVAREMVSELFLPGHEHDQITQTIMALAERARKRRMRRTPSIPAPPSRTPSQDELLPGGGGGRAPQGDVAQGAQQQRAQAAQQQQRPVQVQPAGVLPRAQTQVPWPVTGTAGGGGGMHHKHSSSQPSSLGAIAAEARAALQPPAAPAGQFSSGGSQGSLSASTHSAGAAPERAAEAATAVPWDVLWAMGGGGRDGSGAGGGAGYSDDSDSDGEEGGEMVRMREAFHKKVRQAQKAYEVRQTNLNKAIQESMEEHQRLQEKFRCACEEFQRKKLRMLADHDARMQTLGDEWRQTEVRLRRQRTARGAGAAAAAQHATAPPEALKGGGAAQLTPPPAAGGSATDAAKRAPPQPPHDGS